jgi:hypothetical protein
MLYGRSCAACASLARTRACRFERRRNRRDALPWSRSTALELDIWGCRMPVELIIDQWNPSRRRYRTETFCYGPRSCPLYQAGPARQVPGRRRGMTYLVSYL